MLDWVSHRFLLVLESDWVLSWEKSLDSTQFFDLERDLEFCFYVRFRSPPENCRRRRHGLL